MKTILLSVCVILFSSSLLRSQDKISVDPMQTFIDVYLKSFTAEPGYRESTMSEDMLKRSNESGIWKNPALARFMKQIKIYKTLHFQSSAVSSQQIINKVDAVIKKDNQYKPYIVLTQNEATTYIYIRNNGNKIIELAYIVINQTGIGASSFVGDDINIDSIRSLVPSK